MPVEHSSLDEIKVATSACASMVGKVRFPTIDYFKNPLSLSHSVNRSGQRAAELGLASMR
jgi:hypothetical protein